MSLHPATQTNVSSDERQLQLRHNAALSLHAMVRDLSRTHVQERPTSILKALEAAIAAAMSSEPSRSKDTH